MKNCPIHGLGCPNIAPQGIDVMKGGEKKARSQQGAIEVRLNRALEDVERQKTELASLRARSQVGVACCLQWAWLVYVVVSGGRLGFESGGEVEGRGVDIREQAAAKTEERADDSLQETAATFRHSQETESIAFPLPFSSTFSSLFLSALVYLFKTGKLQF